MSPTAISVNVRLRPSKPSDGSAMKTSTSMTGQQVTVISGDQAKSQTWRCYGADSSQADVFAEVAPLIEQACSGQAATVFTHGVTGSGKTHTMEGTATDPGLIPRSVQALFDKQSNLPAVDFDISLSYMEILNNEVYDLLGNRRNAGLFAPAPLKLKIQDNGQGEAIVAGLTTRQISSMAEFETVFNLAAGTRKTAATALNTASSRSHAILTLLVAARQGKGFVTGRPCLADLAGSENVKIAGGNAERLRESKDINKSLTTLSKVIDALRKGSAHVPYRDSNLTRILQPALGGGSSALLICCIAPGDKFAADTINTLKFGSRSREVINHVAAFSTSSSRSSSSASDRRTSIDHASRPTASSARRSVLADKSNTTRPRPMKKANQPFAKMEVQGEKGNSASTADVPQQKAREVTAEKLPFLPLVEVEPMIATLDTAPHDLPPSNTVPTNPTSPLVANTLPPTILEAVEVEVARMRTLPAEEKEAIGRAYCKKARKLLKDGDLAEANKYFRMAKGGASDSSKLTSLIADIEVNGLDGRLAQDACKRKRDSAESIKDDTAAKPSKRIRSTG